LEYAVVHHVASDSRILEGYRAPWLNRDIVKDQRRRSGQLNIVDFRRSAAGVASELTEAEVVGANCRP
jgi:hypothetical protein